MKNNSVEDLIIYQKYMDLIYYTEMITEKYPRVSKTSIVSTIKNTTYDGMKYILLAYKVYEKKDKLDQYSKILNMTNLMELFNQNNNNGEKTK